MQLAYRIDFMELISVSGANPNGDPAKLGMPRTDSRGFGVISPVCIRRKLRDRLSEMGSAYLYRLRDHAAMSLQGELRRWHPAGIIPPGHVKSGTM